MKANIQSSISTSFYTKVLCIGVGMGGVAGVAMAPLKFNWSHADIASCTHSILVQCVVFSNAKAGGSVQLPHFDITEEKHGGKICVVHHLPKRAPPPPPPPPPNPRCREEALYICLYFMSFLPCLHTFWCVLLYSYYILMMVLHKAT